MSRALRSIAPATTTRSARSARACSIPARIERRARAAQAQLAAALTSDAERVALAAGVDDLLAYVRTRAAALRAWLPATEAR